MPRSSGGEAVNHRNRIEVPSLLGSRSNSMVSAGLTGQNDDHTTDSFGTRSRTRGSTSPGWSLNHLAWSTVRAAKRKIGAA